VHLVQVVQLVHSVLEPTTWNQASVKPVTGCVDIVGELAGGLVEIVAEGISETVGEGLLGLLPPLDVPLNEYPGSVLGLGTPARHSESCGTVGTN
jgi:hypothetical protein